MGNKYLNHGKEHLAIKSKALFGLRSTTKNIQLRINYKQMKKNIKISLLTLLCCLTLLKTVNAQIKKGIKFEEKPLAELLKKSAQSNKLIFMDAYTSWCIPCKWMDQNVFVNDTISSFYNANFVNFKQDMEKGEGPALKAKYKIDSYPTYLFLNAEGIVLHRSGSRMEAREFLKLGMDALDPKKTLPSLSMKYEAGNRNTDFLYDYLIALKKARDPKSNIVAEELKNSLSELQWISKKGWKIMQEFTLNEDEYLGKLLIKNKAQFSNLIGKEEIDKAIDQMEVRSLYGLSRKDSAAFMNKLNRLKKTSKDQRSLILVEQSHYLETKNSTALLKLLQNSKNGYFKNNAMDLSFMIRKIAQDNYPDENVKAEAYLIGKETIKLMPEEYSVQGTFADVCYIFNKKVEGVKAAEKAYELAKLMDSSKIEKLAKEKLNKLQAMPN